MQKTTNYSLNKPEGNDYVNVEVLNENADIIDGKLKDLDDAVNNIDFSDLEQAIASVNNRVTAHLDDSMPHRFSDGTKNYKYGFKTNTANDGLIFVYEEVV